MEGYNKPYKYCIARAIVALALGISSLVFSISGAIFVVIEVMAAASMGFARASVPVAGFLIGALVYAWMFYMGVIMFSGFGIASTLVGKKQGEKFVELYEVDSKMVPKGEQLGKIGLIINIINAGAGLLAAIIVSILVFV